MAYRADNPVIVQSDHTLLLEVDNPRYEQARDDLAPFAELVKSPEHIHTYRITPLSIWNAAAAGFGAQRVLESLERWSKFDLPDNVRFTVEDNLRRYGRLKLMSDDDGLYVTSDDGDLLNEVEGLKSAQAHLLGRAGPTRLRVRTLSRGLLKQALLKAGHPVEDLAGYVTGAPLALALRTRERGGDFDLRAYQTAAADAFWAGGGPTGGSGIVCLPCGAGKTLVGLAAMERAGTQTLILCSSTTAVHQWIREILARTSLQPDEVGEYTGDRKEIRPVTVATYHILTSRRSRGGDFQHFGLFNERDWGLVVYDEVHLLPAPIFRATAEIQARRRLGLTATLVREDGREDDVFSLVGPKRYDVPWRELEAHGWIAAATCHELRVDLPSDVRAAYSVLEGAEQFRLAAENPVKDELVAQLVASHAGERILVIGHYVAQLERLAGRLDAPVLTGATPQAERERRFEDFRRGRTTVLVVSRVANFAVDLPEAAVAIEVSGLFGSRQEEAQRLGRVLRPKADGRPARFYAIVSRDTQEQEYAQKRQLFLVEQGYRYTIQVAATDDAPDAQTAAPMPPGPGAPEGGVPGTATARPAHGNVVPFRPRPAAGTGVQG